MVGRSETPGRRTFAIVPVRALEGAKSRLGAALDAEERRDLVVALLRRTLTALGEVRNVERTVVVSSDEEVLDIARGTGALPLRQLGGGLNAALAQARTVAIELGADEVLVVPGDLAAISAPALDAVVATGDPDAGATRDLARSDVHRPTEPLVVLVPDRHGRGTNGLLLRPPDAIPFAFGGDSRLAHAALARAAGARYLEAPGPLGLDLDMPEDLLLVDATTTDA
jgi:2-phospho-L-lactate guanylyltransferase